MIYSKHKGEHFILLANHKKDSKKWAGLGGKFDPLWDETSLDAAIRETSEESFCYFTEAAFLTAPTDFKPIYEEDFVTYLVEVSYVDPVIIENKQRRKSYCKDKKITNERILFHWAKWSNLKQDLLHLKKANKLSIDGSSKSQELNVLHVGLPGQGNYYRAAYARTLYKFLEKVKDKQYPGWR